MGNEVEDSEVKYCGQRLNVVNSNGISSSCPGPGPGWRLTYCTFIIDVLHQYSVFGHGCCSVLVLNTYRYHFVPETSLTATVSDLFVRLH